MTKQKIKLGAAPKNFKKGAEIVLLSGETAVIEMSYIYRTRRQFAALIDENMASTADAVKATEAAKTAGADESVTEKKKTVADWYKEADEASAEFVLKIADGWDLDDPFTEKSLLQLEDENPGALAAIASIYRAAVAEARTKN